MIQIFKLQNASTNINLHNLAFTIEKFVNSQVRFIWQYAERVFTDFSELIYSLKLLKNSWNHNWRFI